MNCDCSGSSVINNLLQNPNNNVSSLNSGFDLSGLELGNSGMSGAELGMTNIGNNMNMPNMNMPNNMNMPKYKKDFLT